jgi:hypothetical protein
MDYGWPQFTEARILSEYIKTDAHRMEVAPGGAKPPMAVTNAVSWRSEGIRHKKNEVRFCSWWWWAFCVLCVLNRGGACAMC